MKNMLVLLVPALALLGCGTDREPLTAEAIESVHQELKVSGASRWIVTPPSDCDDDCARSAIGNAGGDHGPGIFRSKKVVAVMGERGARDLASRGFTVEEDKVVALGKPVPPPPAQTTPWGVTKIGANLAWPTTAGAGIKVVVIDTGRPSHADINADPLCANFTNETSCADNNGHSTHVGGTIAALNNTIGVVGVAHQSSVYFCKALDRRGSGYFSWIISCINWASSIGAHVMNMSLGAPSGTASLEAACNAADASGTLVVAAAGNEGPGTIGYPAAYGSVVSVGATDSSDVVAYFSSTNSDVELSAPGVSITSTCKGGGTCSMSGTSMASPHAAGAAALVKAANPALTNACVRSLLASTAVDLGTAGRDNAYGHGRINAAAAVSVAPSYVCP